MSKSRAELKCILCAEKIQFPRNGTNCWKCHDCRYAVCMICDDSLLNHELNWVERRDLDILLCLKCKNKTPAVRKNGVATPTTATTEKNTIGEETAKA